MHCIPNALESVRSKYFSSTQDRVKLFENIKSKVNGKVLPRGWWSNILQGEHALELWSKNLMPWDLLISQCIYWGVDGQLCYSMLSSSHRDVMIIPSYQIPGNLRVDVSMSKTTVLFVYYFLVHNEASIPYYGICIALITGVFVLPKKTDIKQPFFHLQPSK